MPYPGGKSQAGVFQRIINLIPPHDTFVELFAGSGAISRLKGPARRTILIDKLRIPDPARFPEGTEILRGCGIEYAERTAFPPDWLIYADPPYMKETRRSVRIYRHELSNGEHERLLIALKKLRCPVIISGYDSPLYRRLLGDWNREEFRVMTRGHSWATEVLWFNFDRPTVLHDCSRIGSNFRERWRITKRKRRWVARLQKLDPLEKAALLSALAAAGFVNLVPSPKVALRT